MRLEPDGQATGCNPVKVGSTPTGLFSKLQGAACKAPAGRNSARPFPSLQPEAEASFSSLPLGSG